MKTSSNNSARRCPCCDQGELHRTTVVADEPFKYETKIHTLHIVDLPVLQCGNCKEIIHDRETDARILSALRKELDLLSPQDIELGLARWDLTVAQAARDTRIRAETFSRWLNGHVIQSQAHNRLLKSYLANPKRFLESLNEVWQGELWPVYRESDQLYTPKLRPIAHQLPETQTKTEVAANSNYALAA